jgi:signal transduction histidine kinase
VTGTASMTLICGVLLAGVFFRGVLFPLRKMAAEARVFTHDDVDQADESAKDELRAVGKYLQMLMSDVAESRSTVQHSREQLLQSEKLAGVGRLAAGVAHEIRNPLNSIRLWLYAIQKLLGPEARLQQEFQAIGEEIQRLERIVRHFLEFSRPPLLKLRQMCLLPLLQKTLELFAHRAEQQQVRLEYQGDDGLPPVMGDAEQLQQVLLNLLGNALDAVPTGGKLSLEATAGNDASGRAMVVVRIRDTGCGIPEADRERIFEPFFTTKPEGTGLGLGIAAQIVAGHNGRLVLESTSAAGTTFAIWIPAC